MHSKHLSLFKEIDCHDNGSSHIRAVRISGQFAYPGSSHIRAVRISGQFAYPGISARLCTHEVSQRHCGWLPVSLQGNSSLILIMWGSLWSPSTSLNSSKESNFTQKHKGKA